ncbi:hypothetical protein [Amycolatopsis sp. NPDC059657]|uniref:hypothetical protein n=1 Tax=Amycolatopsis sp. NPDC059657 TaxID=3346899 RepID=UPI00366FC111
MTWTPSWARERAQQRNEEIRDLVLTEVAREIDFELISRKEPRVLTGTHFYVDVTNFNQLLREERDDHGEDLLRLLHVFAREVSKVIEDDFGGWKVHFQGPRAHAVAYRPVGQGGTMVVKAVLTCLAIRHVTSVFNEIFELDGGRAWAVAAGLDHGECIATKNGAQGDRELLFLGSAANHAAKTLRSSGIRMTAQVRDLLPDGLRARTTSVDEETWCLSLTVGEVERLAGEYGWNWTLEAARQRLTDALERFPSGCISSAEVKESIDKATLRFSSTKRVSGASLFADVDGFTAYIDQLEELGDKTEAVRFFHVLRGVMRDSAVQEFEALRIQYQGDRMQALAYRPVADEAAAAFDAVRLAAALTTVADEIVPEVTGVPRQRLAIGLSWGEVLVSKIGQHGRADYVSLGASTASAANIQQRLDGGQIGIDRGLRERLPAWLQDIFSWDESAKAYVTSIGWSALSALVESESARAVSIRPWRQS